MYLKIDCVVRFLFTKLQQFNYQGKPLLDDPNKPNEKTFWAIVTRKEKNFTFFTTFSRFPRDSVLAIELHETRQPDLSFQDLSFSYEKKKKINKKKERKLAIRLILTRDKFTLSSGRRFTVYRELREGASWNFRARGDSFLYGARTRGKITVARLCRCTWEWKPHSARWTFARLHPAVNIARKRLVSYKLINQRCSRIDLPRPLAPAITPLRT